MYYPVDGIAEFNYPIKAAADFHDAGSLQYLSTFGESWGLVLGDLGVIFAGIHDP